MDFAKGLSSWRAFCGDNRDGRTGKWRSQRGDKHPPFSCCLYGCGYECRQKKEMVKVAQQYFSATMTPDVAVKSIESSILMYKGGRGKVQVQVIFDTNTFWLSQQRIAELFGVTQQDISYHLLQIEESGEIHLSDAYKKILLPSDKWSGEVMMYDLERL